MHTQTQTLFCFLFFSILFILNNIIMDFDPVQKQYTNAITNKL